MTVSIVSPKAPKNVNATMRCARVGLGRGAASGFVSVGGVVTVGFANSIGYDARGTALGIIL
jgi:hypothetical protein